MEGFDQYVGGGDDLHSSDSSRPFDSDGYLGFDPRLPSQRFESSFHVADGGYSEDQYAPDEHNKELEEEEEYKGSNGHGGHGFDLGVDVPPPYQSAFDDDLGESQSPAMSSTFGGQSFESRLQPEFASGDAFSPSVESNGKGYGHETAESLFFAPSGEPENGAVLPPPEEMQPEEGFMLREWKRLNAIRLEEKSRQEREALSQIIDAADAFKDEFYEKRRRHCETTKTNNREKEKVFLENQEKFHANADKHYWKAVAELIPNELPSMELKSRGNKDKKKPTVVINKGPKPGKATDMTRMRQVLVKLKHNPPAHMKAPPPPPPAKEGAESKRAAPEAASAPPQRQGSGQQAVVA